MTHYAGIGARLSPVEILPTMTMIGSLLGARGFTLRSGGAKGADTAFEQGCDLVNGKKIIRIDTLYSKALEHASLYHPNWRACDENARSLHARNSLIMCGDHFDDPVKFVVCWTPDDAIVGGTGQALRIADDLKIPVFNLCNDPSGARLWEWLDNGVAL